MSNDPFKIRDHVPDFEAISRQYEEMSARTVARHRHVSDIAYGPSGDERLDIFLPGNGAGNAPIHMFVHGGYWRAGSRKSYAYMAEPVLAAGGVAVIADYGLMPGVRMAEIVTQVRRAASWCVANAREYGADPARFTASGHSAGAHLASFLAARAPHEADLPQSRPGALLLVSGIYDLGPIPHSFLQPEIHMTIEEVGNWSPVDAVADRQVWRVFAVGADETPPFHEQQARLAASLDPAVTSTVSLDGLNHMSVIAEMGDPATEAGTLLQDIVTG